MSVTSSDRIWGPAANQNSYSFTDKKSRNFPGLSRTTWKIFQHLFVAHKCLNVTCWHHKFKIREVKVICEWSEQKFFLKKTWFSFEPIKICKNTQFSRIFFQDFPDLGIIRKNPGLSTRHGNPGQQSEVLRIQYIWIIWSSITTCWTIISQS